MSTEDTVVVDRGDDFEPTPDTVPAPVIEEASPLGDPDVAEVVGDIVEEADAEAEPEPEPEAETTENSADKGRFIPKDRFDEAVAKERAEKERLASRLAEIEKRDADRAVAADLNKASAQIKEMIKEHTKMLADGELDQASNLMGDILQLQSDMADYRSRTYADQGRNQAKSEMQYDAVVARLEMDYPELNPDNVEVFDRDAVRKVQAYMTGLMQMDNMSSSKALQEAVGTILGAKRANENQSEDAKRKAAEDLGMRRKEAAVTKAVDAKGKQPAALKDIGMDHDKTGGQLDAAAIMQMSQEEFMKLPDEQLSRLRGDTL